jgi:protein-tyrosine phosphatase
MVDLHSHVLPGLDDGPPTLAGSLELARMAAGSGTRLMVATPHVRSDYDVEVAEIPSRVAELNAELERIDLPLRVVAGAEVAVPKLLQLPEQELRAACLGESNYLLVESPYTDAVSQLEEMLFRLQLMGLRPILAHPERSRLFQRQPERLARMVESGVLTSVTAASLSGRFGQAVRDFALRLFRQRLVHNVASDAHDTESRAPGMLDGFESAARQLPALAEHAGWYTVTAPVALLAGRPLPEVPALPAGRAGRQAWLKPIAAASGMIWR